MLLIKKYTDKQNATRDTYASQQGNITKGFPAEGIQQGKGVVDRFP